MQRLLPASKLVREGRIWQNSGAYARACGRLSMETTAEVCDEVLAELRKRIAQALGAKRLLPNGERRVCWRPSSFERKKYPELAADAAIEGRLIVVT